ncbi:hypothetical protein B0H14DRAFT_1379599 [Mycena olivaceomarginata]|nr:hypothetical protein B0H14DRAFT_1379599 [Mycena olivaceomarginata]
MDSEPQVYASFSQAQLNNKAVILLCHSQFCRLTRMGQDLPASSTSSHSWICFGPSACVTPGCFWLLYMCANPVFIESFRAVGELELMDAMILRCVLSANTLQMAPMHADHRSRSSSRQGKEGASPLTRCQSAGDRRGLRRRGVLRCVEPSSRLIPSSNPALPGGIDPRRMNKFSGDPRRWDRLYVRSTFVSSHQGALDGPDGLMGAQNWPRSFLHSVRPMESSDI